MAEIGRPADRRCDLAAIDHGERNTVRPRDDERVDERIIVARTGAAALTQREAGSNASSAYPLAPCEAGVERIQPTRKSFPSKNLPFSQAVAYGRVFE